MLDAKYTKAEIVKAIVAVTGTPCNPRNREQAWIVLNRICSERGIANPLATADEPKPLSTVTDDIGVIDDRTESVAPNVAVINDGHERFAKVIPLRVVPSNAERMKHAERCVQVEDEEPKVVLIDPNGKRHRVGTREFEAIVLLSHGTTQERLSARFGWEPHTARGLIHGSIKRRYGFTVSATKHGKGKGSYTLYKINEPVNTVPA